MKLIYFIVSCSTAGLSHRKLASCRMSHDNCSAQGSDKRNTLFKKTQYYCLFQMGVFFVVGDVLYTLSSHQK